MPLRLPVDESNDGAGGCREELDELRRRLSADVRSGVCACPWWSFSLRSPPAAAGAEAFRPRPRELVSKPLAAPAEAAAAAARGPGASGPWMLLSTSLPLSRAALAAAAVDVFVTIVSCTEHTQDRQMTTRWR